MTTLDKLITHFNDHVAHCHTCRSGQMKCELGQALLVGIGKLVAQECAPAEAEKDAEL